MLKIALIGYGYWGSKLARNFQNLETFKLISIADIKSKNLSLAKKNYPLAKTSNDYKSIIKNNIIDLVIISSPTTTHYKICFRKLYLLLIILFKFFLKSFVENFINFL